MDLLARGRIAEAAGKFRYTISIAGLDGPGAQAMDQLEALYKTAMERLEEATDLYHERQYAEAMDRAVKIRKTYGNLFGDLRAARKYRNVGKLAATLIRRIENDPQARSALRERSAARAYAKVQKLWANTESDPTVFHDIYTGLKSIAQRYEDTPTGEKCARQAKELLADEEARVIIEREAERRFIASALQAAEQYERSGLTEEAKAEYTKLTNRFPDKPLADLREMAKKPT